MPDLMETIDQSLQEVEEQLLQEFDRIRNTLSDARFEAIDTGIKTALASVVLDLQARLDRTGDSSNLQLMTEQHEVLLARMAVLRQLLDSKVPTAFLHEAHQEVISNRRRLEAKVAKQRDSQQSTHEEPAADETGKGGLMSKLKGMFSAGESETKSSNNKIKVTAEEQKALEPVSIYLDNGIYSASRELAALANVFNLPESQKQLLQESHEKKMRAVISGKAQFESKDLSAQAEEPTDGKAIAQTPEQIRKKLAERDNSSAGASSFESRDLSSEAPPTRDKEIAQTPDQIRRKLAERSSSQTSKASFSSRDISHEEAVATAPTQTQKTLTATEIAAERKAALEAEKASQPTTGKASFISKDIDPVVPQEVPRKPLKKIEQASSSTPSPAPSGKAVFESKDLSSPPPGEKR